MSMSHPVHVEDWLQLIRAEFEDPSSLRVDVAAAAERWPLDLVRLTAILDALTYSGYLRQSLSGEYFRRHDDELLDPARLPDIESHAAMRAGLSRN